MRSVRTACQTITWGNDQSRNFPEIFSSVKTAGFQGVEIGWRHLQATNPENLRKELSSCGLELVASHIGGNLQDLNQAGKEKGMLSAVLEYLEKIGCSTLMYSGFNYGTDDGLEHLLKKDLESLAKAADTCAARGVRLLYHNHNWEFAQDWRIMKAILSAPIPNLGFCPDIGWLAKAHVEVSGFLDKIRDRIGMVHFKDFSSFDEKMDAVELGTGVADLGAAASWIKKNIKDGIWVAAEQDVSSIGPDKSAMINAKYLKNIFHK
ncbi:MAG: sugar phosphate isomerase/epimerase [Victivallales bacterium]